MLSRAALRELRDEVGRIEQERAELQRRVADLDRHLQIVQKLLAFYDAADEESDESPTGVKSIRNEILAILREGGKPLPYRAIYEHLLARGVEVPGKEPLKNVAAHLSNDQRFRRMGQGLWGLASWPVTTAEQGEGVQPLLPIGPRIPGPQTFTASAVEAVTGSRDVSEREAGVGREREREDVPV